MRKKRTVILMPLYLAFYLNVQAQPPELDIDILPYEETAEQSQPEQRHLYYQIPFDPPADSLINNPAIEHIFYAFTKMEYLRPSVVKVAVDKRVPDPKNFLQKQLLLQVLEGRRQAWHILVKDLGVERSKHSPNFNYSPYDNFYYANYNERAPISKADLLEYVKNFFKDTDAWTIDFSSLTDQQIVFLLGNEAQLSLIKKFFWHPRRNQLVSFAVGVVLQFPSKIRWDSPKINLPYLGEPIYIPLNEVGLSAFDCLDLNAPAFSWVAQLDQMAYFQENDAEESRSDFALSPIKGKTSDFLNKRIKLPVLNGQLKIFKERSTYETQGKPEGKKFLNANLRLMTTDTVFTFDPETYEEIKKVVTNKVFDFQECQRFKMEETVYFDIENFRFLSVVNFIAPSYDVHDNEGNFRYSKPVFWMHWKGLNCGEK